MFSMLSKDGRVGLRLGKDNRDAFIKKYDTRLFKNYGAVMKEYVEVPDRLLENLTELQPYLALSFEYVKL